MENNDVFSLTADLWIEILLRIPGESLIQLKSVCKLWHRLIVNNERFARWHLHHWSSREDNIKLKSGQLFMTYGNKKLFLISLDHADLNPQPCNLHDCLNQLIPSRYYNKYSRNNVSFRLLHSRHGLLLIKVGLGDFHDCTRLLICNPVTRTYRTLPKCLTPSALEVDGGIESMNHIWHVIYDSDVRRYKIIGVIGPMHKSFITCFVLELWFDRNYEGGEVELRNNDWKELSFTIPSEGWRVLHATTSCDDDERRLLILATKYPRDDNDRVREWGLMELDTSKEEIKDSIHLFNMPPPYDLMISQSNGTFRFVTPIGENLGFYLWTLDGSSDNPTWLKERFFIKWPTPKCFAAVWKVFMRERVKVFRDGTKLVMHMPWGKEIVTYDTITSCVTIVPLNIDGSSTKEALITLTNHVNSLISWKQ